MKKSREKKKRSKPLLEPAVQENSSGLARALGSTDRDTREKGLGLLCDWLESHDNVSQKDLIRLWKALYFCYWHSDLVSVQTALAERLSGLLCQLSPPVALSYFKAFVETMKREWAGIDQHRMNKYLILVRKFYSACLELFKQSTWDLELIETYSTVLKDDVILLPTANDLGAGFAYYLCEIVVPELGRCQDRSPSNDALVAILDPFVQGLAETKNTILLKKMRNDIFHEIPEHLDTVPFSSLDIMAMAEHLFTLGSRADTHARNRKNLYEISSILEKSAKKPRKDTIPSLSDSGVAKQTKKKKRSSAEQNGLSINKTVAEEKEQQEQQPTKKMKKKKKKTSVTPIEAGATPVSDPVPESQPSLRKSVRINLRKNLVRRIGEPPFPENVRTPPTSKPKGSALKQGGKTLEKPSRKQALTFDQPKALPEDAIKKNNKKKKSSRNTM